MRYDIDWRYFPPPRRHGGGYPDRGYGARREGLPRYLEGHPVERGYDADLDGGGHRGFYGPARYGLGPYHERLRRRRRSDEDLREDVTEALFYDTWVDADAIAVEVAEGVVTLRGELPSYDEIRFATDDAWDVEGVIGVRTELRVSDE